MRTSVLAVTIGAFGILAPLVLTSSAAGGAAPPLVLTNQHFPDWNGTCSTSWANDTYKRVFTVAQSSDGSWILTSRDSSGTFVTVAGQSPNGCYGRKGGTVAAGVKGTFSGTIAGPVTGGTFNPDTFNKPDFTSCATAKQRICTSSELVQMWFGKAARWACAPRPGSGCTYRFVYKAKGQGLAAGFYVRTATTASGDIATVAGAPPGT